LIFLPLKYKLFTITKIFDVKLNAGIRNEKNIKNKILIIVVVVVFQFKLIIHFHECLCDYAAGSSDKLTIDIVSCSIYPNKDNISYKENNANKNKD